MTSGFSAAGLDRLWAKLAGHVHPGGTSSLVALVARAGEVHLRAFGTLSHEAGSAQVEAGSIFRIASMTKPIAAAAAMILVEEGKLQLDAPIAQWLPELANPRVLRSEDAALDDTVPARRPITPRDVLTYTFGHGVMMRPPDSTPIQRAMREKRLSTAPPKPRLNPAPEEWLRRFATLPLIDQPGERWRYHVSGDLLGVLIARASGQPFAGFLRERLFAPLGMRDTDFHVPPEKINRFTTCHAVAPDATGQDALGVYDEPRGQWSRAPAFPSGGGGLVSTAPDCLAFQEMLLGGGARNGVRILSPESVAEMTRDQLTESQKRPDALQPGFFDTRGWGFGMSVVTRDGAPGEPAGRFGWDGGLGSSAYASPRDGLITVLLTSLAWRSPEPPQSSRDLWVLGQAALN